MTDERELIERARRGDRRAYRELYDNSRVAMYRLAYDLTGNVHDAEDLIQDVYVKAFRSLPEFRGDAKWSTWLYRIGINTALDRKRKKVNMIVEYNIELEQKVAAGTIAASHDLQPDDKADTGLLRDHITRALGRLSPRERSVFVLRHYHNMTLREVSVLLSVAEGTVKSLLFRAVRRLRHELAWYRYQEGNKPL